MQVVSELVEIENNGHITTEYVEERLKELNISPLRWAVVNVHDKMITVSVANIKEKN